MSQRAKAKVAGVGAASGTRPAKQKSSRRAAKASDAASAEAGVRAPGATIDNLEADCRALRAELVAAKAEIARLNKRQELVVNRIDWVIDSLHNLLDDED